MKDLKRLGVNLAIFLGLYFLVRLFVPVSNIQYDIHGWGYLVLILCVIGCYAAKSFLAGFFGEALKDKIDVSDSIRYLFKETIDWSIIGFGFLIAAYFAPTLVAAQAPWLFVGWFAIVGFCGGLADLITERLGFGRRR